MADALTEKIIGAAIEVHRTLGPGLLESIYEEALCYELTLQHITFERQLDIDVVYKGHIIKGQRLDATLPEVAMAQTLSYLKATGRKGALIINFGEERLVDGIKRVSL